MRDRQDEMTYYYYYYLKWTIFQFAYKGQTIPSSKIWGIDNRKTRWHILTLISTLTQSQVAEPKQIYQNDSYYYFVAFNLEIIHRSTHERQLFIYYSSAHQNSDVWAWLCSRNELARSSDCVSSSHMSWGVYFGIASACLSRNVQKFGGYVLVVWPCRAFALLSTCCTNFFF